MMRMLFLAIRTVGTDSLTLFLLCFLWLELTLTPMLFGTSSRTGCKEHLCFYAQKQGARPRGSRPLPALLWVGKQHPASQAWSTRLQQTHSLCNHRKLVAEVTGFQQETPSIVRLRKLAHTPRLASH